MNEYAHLPLHVHEEEGIMVAGTWGRGDSIHQIMSLRAPSIFSRGRNYSKTELNNGIVDCWGWGDKWDAEWTLVSGSLNVHQLGSPLFSDQWANVPSVTGKLGAIKHRSSGVLGVGFESIHQVSIQWDLIPPRSGSVEKFGLPVLCTHISSRGC